MRPVSNLLLELLVLLVRAADVCLALEASQGPGFSGSIAQPIAWSVCRGCVNYLSERVNTNLEP